MKKSITLLLIFFFCQNLFSQKLANTQQLTGAPTLSCCPSQPLSPSDYQVVFRDDFDGDSLNTVEWKDNYLNPALPKCINVLTSSPMIFKGIGENIFVNNGTLKLLATKLDSSQQIYCNGGYVKYGISQVWTYKKWRYGRFEARFKLPKGQAFWPSFWLQNNFGTNGYDEIDIFEAYGNSGTIDEEPLHYTCNIHNSTSGSFDAYSDAVDPAEAITTMSSGEWNVAVLEWTPYHLVIKMNDIVIMETYRYYKISNGTKTPVTCKPDLVSINKDSYIENMSFPDNAMNVCFNLNLTHWELGSNFINDFPATMEVDYFQVEQLPPGLYGECETKGFCTYSAVNYKDSVINICSSGNTASPKAFNLYPANADWSSYDFSYSSNINANLSSNNLSLIAPYPLNGEGWFQFNIPANAQSGCIGQDRILNKKLNFQTYLNSYTVIFDDSIEIVEGDQLAMLPGYHSVKITSISPEISDLVYEILVNGSRVNYNNGREAYFMLEPNSWITLEVRIKNACVNKMGVVLSACCSDNIPVLIFSDGNTFIKLPFKVNETKELCYGNHSISIENFSQYSNVEVLKYTNYNYESQLITNGSFNILATNSLDEYIVKWFDPACQGITGYTFYIIGRCCFPGKTCDGNCSLDANPNPASYSLSINAPATGTSPTGATYVPVIREINVYNRYMQQVKQVNVGDVTSYNLNVLDLINNEFYIIESKDQYYNTCRKTIIISR